MSDVLGLPLLSGPPPLAEQGNACRKCNKEFNMFLNRSRKCNHCGYYYCHSCTDYQAIMPRTGQDTQAGYDIMNVCAFCIDQLNVTAATKTQLKSMPLSKLRKYVDAYNIKIDRVVEKDDIIEAIQNARRPNGCLPSANENYYRKHSVPNRTSGQTRHGFFSSRPTPDRPSSRPPPRPATTRPTHNFPRPDLEPDHPPPPPPRHHPGPAQGAPPQPSPRPQPFYTSPQQPYPQPHGHYQYGQPSYPPYNPHTGPTGYAQPAPPPPPPRDPRPGHPPARPPPPPHYSHPYAQPHAQYPGQGGYYQNPTASRSSHNVHQTSSTSTGPSTAPPPRPRAASAAPPPTAPPPTLNELLSMSPESIAALSIGTLKAVLFNNHVNAGMVLEKGDLVHKVQSLIEDERRERQRQRETEEREERERIEREREMLEEYSRVHQEQEEQERTQNERVEQGGGETEAARPEPEETRPLDEEAPKPVPKSPPPTPPKPSMHDRTGLCVICQDEEANIAIVDCGHLAMCRGCSELIMNSSRECPLCRTRIVTEARLLRIFKP